MQPRYFINGHPGGVRVSYSRPNAPIQMSFQHKTKNEIHFDKNRFGLDSMGVNRRSIGGIFGQTSLAECPSKVKGDDFLLYITEEKDTPQGKKKICTLVGKTYTQTEKRADIYHMGCLETMALWQDQQYLKLAKIMASFTPLSAETILPNMAEARGFKDGHFNEDTKLFICRGLQEVDMQYFGFLHQHRDQLYNNESNVVNTRFPTFQEFFEESKYKLDPRFGCYESILQREYGAMDGTK